jgi:hypothetical protein
MPVGLFGRIAALLADEVAPCLAPMRHTGGVIRM